jgi:hypothetical protein
MFVVELVNYAFYLLFYILYKSYYLLRLKETMSSNENSNISNIQKGKVIDSNIYKKKQ